MCSMDIYDTHTYSRPALALLCKVGSVDDDKNTQTGAKILVISFQSCFGPGLFATPLQYGCTSPRPADAKFKSSAGLSLQTIFCGQWNCQPHKEVDWFPHLRGVKLVNLIGWGQDCTVQAILRQLWSQNVQGSELPRMSSGIAERHSRHSLLRWKSHFHLKAAGWLADVKSPHLSAVTQQTVQAVSSLFKNPVSFLIWTYCRKQTAGKGLTQKKPYWHWYLLSVSLLCTAWPFEGCVNVGEIPQRGHDSEF